MSSVDQSWPDVAAAVVEMGSKFAALGVMPTTGQTVADIGSSSGLVGFALIRHVADATCISIGAADALDDARQLAAEVGVQDRATFITADVTRLDLEADSIDVALLGDAVMALDNEYVSAALANIRRAIRPGGVLYLAGTSSVDASNVTLRPLLDESGFDNLSTTTITGGGYVLRRFALSAA